MKALRVLLGVVLALIVLVAILVVVALVPAVQTWAVRKAAASQPELDLEVSRVAAGFSKANLENVHLVRNGTTIKAQHVSAKYSAWDYLTKRRITVNDLVVEGLLIDARPPVATGGDSASAPAAGSPTGRASPEAASPGGKPFRGLLSGIEVPDLSIARFSVPGRIELPGQRSGTFELRGSDIGTGKRGTVDWKADLNIAQPDSPVRAVHSAGTANVNITTEHRIESVEINMVVSADGAKLPADQLKLEAKAEQPAAGGNEGYTATLSLLRGNTVEPLATLAGQYNATANEIAGAWKVGVRNEQVAALLAGLGLPDIAAEGTGKFSANPEAGSGAASGELRSTIAHPEKISPQLAAVGNLQVQLRFDGRVAERAIRIEQLAVDVANGRKFAQVRTLQPIGFSLADKRVTFTDAAADLARVTIDALPLAWAQPFLPSHTIESGTASAALAVAAAPDGSRVRITPVEPLVLRNVTVRSGNARVVDQLNLTVSPRAEYAADQLRAVLDQLAITTSGGDELRGRITADIAGLSGTRTITFSTDTQAKVTEALLAALPIKTGPLVIETRSEGRLAGQTLHFNRSQTKVSRLDGPALANIELRKPLSFDMTAKTISAAAGEGDTLSVTLGDIPLAWFAPLVEGSRIEGQVAGGVVAVTLRTLDDITATSSKPVAIRGLTLDMSGQPMLQNVDVFADFSVRKHGQTVDYTIRSVEARQGDTPLVGLGVTGQANLGDKLTFAAKGSLDANATALMLQPMAAGKAALARGTVHADFDASVADTVQAKAKVTATDLVAKQDNRPLGTAILELNAALQPDGSTLVHAPFSLATGTRRSDAVLEGRLVRTAGQATFNGRISSNQLFLEDVTPLASLVPATPENAEQAGKVPPRPQAGPPQWPMPPTNPSSAPTSGPAVVTAGPAPSKPEQPFWSAAMGKIDLDMKEVTYGRDYLIKGIQGGATLSPAQLAVRATGTMNGNPFQLDGVIDFAAGQPQPYTLAATTQVGGFDLGAFLRAANPNEKPQIEALVDLNAQLRGRGSDLTSLVKNTYGTFDFSGSRGVLRALGQRKLGTAVGVASAVAGMLGAARGDATTMAAADLASRFTEMPFEHFRMHVERGADLNLKVTNLEFLSQDTRITGTGGILNQPGVPVQNQPIQFTLQLGAKGAMAHLLQQRNLLSPMPDPQGFQAMTRTFNIGGSAAKPDSSELWGILLGQLGSSGLLDNFLKR